MGTGRGFVLGAVLASLLAGCAPKVLLHRQSEHFTYQTLQAGKLAVLGVTSLVGDDEARDASRERMNVLLETALMSERGDLGVERQGLARAELEELLDRYQRTGDVDTATVPTLRELIGGKARYVVLARILDETVSREQTEEDPDNDAKTDNTRNRRTSYRTVRVGFQVYDLQLRETAWSADLVRSGKNSVTWDDEPKSNSKGFLAVLDFVVSAITTDDEPDYPEPPETTAVLRDLFEDFAESLPKPKR